jgi:predicted ATPase
MRSRRLEENKQRWGEAEVHRVAGEIALKSPQPDAAKAEGYFQRALAVARQQQAKSWELRAAMSTARLWRDQGKRDEAREVLAPVFGWFTEGFDTGSERGEGVAWLLEERARSRGRMRASTAGKISKRQMVSPEGVSRSCENIPCNMRHPQGAMPLFAFQYTQTE